MSEPIKHHWVPKFLLKKWETETGEIPTWSLAGPQQKLVSKNYSAESICSKKYLYSMASESEINKQRIETEYLQKIDNNASPIVEKIESGHSLTDAERYEFSRFVFNLHLRNPATITRMERNSKTNEIIPVIINNALSTGLLRYPVVLSPERQDIIIRDAVRIAITQDEQHSIVTNLIRQFRWHFICTAETEYPIPLITSDQPIVVYNGLMKRDSEIFLPLGPNLLFWATRHANFDPRTVDGRTFSIIANKQQTFSAMERVYGQANQRFIENNFAHRQRLSKLKATLP